MAIKRVLAINVLFVGATACAQGCDPTWQSLGGVNGVDNQVSRTIVWDPDGAGPRAALLVVAGEHDVAGNVISPNLTAWDGTQWLQLNDAPLDGVIDALAIDGNDLLVGGSFSNVGGVSARNVARRTANGWQALGEGLDERVYAMQTYNNEVYASGEFNASGSQSLNKLAKWNGTAWVPVGGPEGTDEPIMAFTQLGSDLIAVGGFTSIGGVAANRVARWDGAAWSAMGAGFNEQARCAIVHNGQLLVGGWFSASGETELAAGARWTGNEWVSLTPPGDGTQNLYNFTILNNEVYATGSIAAGIRGYTEVARLTSAGWVPVTNETDGFPSVFAAYAIAGYNGSLHVSGFFRTQGQNSATRIARWDGQAWVGLGTGNAARVFGATSFQNKAIVYGDFTLIGGQPIRGIAAFDGQTWSSLGAGITDPSGTPNATCIWNDKLVVVGSFTSINNTNIAGVALWDGAAWTSLSQPVFGAVQACAVLDGTLYIGGELYDEQGTLLGTVLRWTGTAWEAAGAGTDTAVYAMAAYNGKLYVGGDFTIAGNAPANGIAAWNGTRWESLTGPSGEGVNGGVGALFVYRDELIVGARLFTNAGGLPISSIARWDGLTWSGLGAGLDFPATVTSMIERDGKLIVGGLFASTAGVPLGNIAVWDGASQLWSSLGSGTNQYVTGFGRAGNDIIAGGLFTVMDGQPSAYVARLACQGCDDIDFNNNDVFPEDQDVIDFFNVLAGATCTQCNDIDFNNNDVFPEDQDVIDFFTVLAGGECS
jgi:hypothetical protein